MIKNILLSRPRKASLFLGLTLFGINCMCGQTDLVHLTDLSADSLSNFFICSDAAWPNSGACTEFSLLDTKGTMIAAIQWNKKTLETSSIDKSRIECIKVHQDSLKVSSAPNIKQCNGTISITLKNDSAKYVFEVIKFTSPDNKNNKWGISAVKVHRGSVHEKYLYNWKYGTLTSYSWCDNSVNMDCYSVDFSGNIVTLVSKYAQLKFRKSDEDYLDWLKVSNFSIGGERLYLKEKHFWEEGRRFTELYHMGEYYCSITSGNECELNIQVTY